MAYVNAAREPGKAPAEETAEEAVTEENNEE